MCSVLTFIFFSEQVFILVFYAPGLLHHPIDRRLQVKLQIHTKTIEINQMTGTSVYTNTDNAAGFIYHSVTTAVTTADQQAHFIIQPKIALIQNQLPMESIISLLHHSAHPTFISNTLFLWMLILIHTHYMKSYKQFLWPILYNIIFLLQYILIF